MRPSRRFTPPLPTLTAFEAVARLGSVTKAAGELNLTQSAVSRQIQRLEEQTGTALFERHRKRLQLTTSGARYANEIRAALTRITNATFALQANPDGGVLNLAILPSIGTHWLAPRLSGFFEAHPGITLNMSTRTDAFDFAFESFHAAIHFVRRSWPGERALKLLDEQMVAVATPELLQSGPVTDLPRLQLETRPYAWREWTTANGWPGEGRPVMSLDQFATMLRAAQSGLGVALMPDYLVEDEIARGTLAEPPGVARVRMGTYFLVWPEENAECPALTAFRSWLASQTQDRVGKA